MKNIASVSVAAAVAAASFVCGAKTSADYDNGQTMLHLPFDSDFLSMENAQCNAQSHYFTGSGSATFVTADKAGASVVRWGAVRKNEGALSVSGGRLLLDISAFGFDADLTETTIEFFFKAKASDMGNWSRMLCIGPVNKTDETLTAASPFAFLVQVDRDEDKANIYPRADSASDVKIRAVWSKPALDGLWHHFAITVTDEKKIEFYLDYKSQGSQTLSQVWRGRTPADGQMLGLAIGSGNNSFMIDEFRITKGALGVNMFLRMDQNIPADGETLLYMPFEGDLSSIVHGEYMGGPKVKSGTPVYSDDVWESCIKTKDGSQVVRRENKKCLKMTGETKVNIPYWALYNWVLDSATIEFFVKGGMDTSHEAWFGPFAIVSDKGVYPASLSVDKSDPRRWYMRADAYNPATFEKEKFDRYVGTSAGTANDGRWHHVAFTFEKYFDKSGTAKSRCQFWFDYAKVGDPHEYLSHTWCGMSEDMYIRFGVAPCLYWIDELRISKGVLPPGKFLRARVEGLRLMLR